MAQGKHLQIPFRPVQKEGVDMHATDKCRSSPHDVKADLKCLMAQYALPSIHSLGPEFQAIDSLEATKTTCAVLKRLNAALETNDTEKLESCFFAEQAFWKDQLALTWHLRTFISRANIAKSLLETKALRKMTGKFEIEGEAEFIHAGPNLVSCLSAITYFVPWR